MIYISILVVHLSFAFYSETIILAINQSSLSKAAFFLNGYNVDGLNVVQVD